MLAGPIQVQTMKKITVEVGDEANAELIETVEVKHLSDLGEGVKQVVDDFVARNEGVVSPPVCIEVTEQQIPAKSAPADAAKK
jgi:hypothetical protein